MSIVNDPKTPVSSDSYGYALSFVPKSGLYGACAAEAVLAGLRQMRFSGRCEYHVWESPRGDDYVVSLAIKNRTGAPEPSYLWWKEFAKAAAKASASRSEAKLDIQSSELASVEGMRRGSLPPTIVEFADGEPCLIDDEQDTWFSSECANRIANATQQ